MCRAWGSLHHVSLILYVVVGVGGLEPPTSWSQTRSPAAGPYPDVVEVTGIEPASTECKSVALPLSYTPLAAQVGIEPTTLRLTAACSTAELLGTGWEPLDWQEVQGTCEEAPEEFQLAERLNRI